MMTHACASPDRVPSLYADEDVGSGLVSALRRLGHDVTRTVDAGQSGSEDPAQLAYAARHGLILITHNRHHFRSLNRIWSHWRPLGLQSHLGILAVPQPRPERPGYSAVDAARMIDQFLAEREQIADEFYRWHPAHGWTP
jgi:hypothetical protein